MAPEIEVRWWRLAAAVVALGTGLLACGGGGDDADRLGPTAATAPTVTAWSASAPASPGATGARSEAVASPPPRAAAAPCAVLSPPALPLPPHGAAAGLQIERQATLAALDAATAAANAQHAGGTLLPDPFDASDASDATEAAARPGLVPGR